ncbi:group II intron reverse transcriptase/maturase, partial [Salmonella enterica subsp. enterica]|nr:group II intron reverse transcriptase/maturase [Salmonella enterica subsp. enterica serovar Paratyphi A]
YCFRQRMVKSQKGIYFMGFTPAVSKEAGKNFREKIRNVIKEMNTTDIVLLSQKLNPIIRGWMNYFMKYTPSEAFRQGINYVNLTLTRWLVRTRKKVRRSYIKSQHLLYRIAMSNPERFYHWKVGYMPVR